MSVKARTWLLISILLLSGLTASAQVDNPEQDPRLRRATKLWEQKLFWEAEPLFRQAAAAWPRHGPSHFGLALCLLQSNRVKESLPHFEKAENCPHPEAQFFTNHGVALELLSRIEESIRMLERGLEIDPRSAHAYLNLGKIATRRGEWEQAGKLLGKCLEIQPRNLEALFLLATAEHRHGRLERATELARTVAKLEPRHAGCSYLLFQILRRKSADARAEKKLDESARLDAEARRYLTLAKKLQIENQKRVSLQVKTGELIDLAFGFLRQKQPEKAIGYFAKILELDPSHRHARSALENLANAYVKLGQGSHPIVARIRTLLGKGIERK